jgi:hypothetical protein
MTPQTHDFKQIVLRTLAGTPVREHLGDRSAVVLERIARGGGATRWYYCADAGALEAIAGELRPGSAVSFFFDDRIRSDVLSPDVRLQIENMMEAVGETTVGILRTDNVHIDVAFVSDWSEVEDCFPTVDPAARIFYGEFPGRDNDGLHAVTLILPDRDGIVRNHPH